jgi:hypothetical protein
MVTINYIIRKANSSNKMIMNFLPELVSRVKDLAA